MRCWMKDHCWRNASLCRVCNCAVYGSGIVYPEYIESSMKCVNKCLTDVDSSVKHRWYENKEAMKKAIIKK